MHAFCRFMRVIVTRPEREAHAWAQAMVQRGLEVSVLPLIDIHPTPDTSALCAAWRQLGDYVALMFVSAAAVEHFFTLRASCGVPGDIPGVLKARFWGTGPGTRAALLRQGVDPVRIDAPAHDGGQFDSEALWRVVQVQVRPGDRVLIVRGGDKPQDPAAAAGTAGAGFGRDWLAQRLIQAGAQVEFVLAYWRGAPVFNQLQRETARDAASDGSVWLFTSARAVANLLACLPGQRWAGARALATHARIANAARAAGFGVVWESRPSVSDVVASIESIG